MQQHRRQKAQTEKLTATTRFISERRAFRARPTRPATQVPHQREIAARPEQIAARARRTSRGR